MFKLMPLEPTTGIFLFLTTTSSFTLPPDDLMLSWNSFLLGSNWNLSLIFGFFTYGMTMIASYLDSSSFAKSTLEDMYLLNYLFGNGA